MPTHTTIKNRDNAVNWMSEDINSLYRFRESNGRGGRPHEGEWKHLSDPMVLPQEVKYLVERQSTGERVYFEFHDDTEEMESSEQTEENENALSRIKAAEESIEEIENRLDKIVRRQLFIIEGQSKSAAALNSAVDAVNKSISIYQHGISVRTGVEEDSSKTELYRGLSVLLQRGMDITEGYLQKGMTEERKKSFDKYLKMETILRDSEASVEDITASDLSLLLSIRQDPEAMNLFRTIMRETHRRRLEKAQKETEDSDEEKNS